MDVTVRRLESGDLPAVDAIQKASPEAAQWNPADYLAYHCIVAICNDTVAGFLVTRAIAHGETEILNIAVAPEFRRKGVASRLISHDNVLLDGTVYLEVRASNQPALAFYASAGFELLYTRRDYYENPVEDARVMARDI